MSGWPVLDVAIGLVFVYLLLSLICTAVNEGLMTQLRSRAKFLDQGLLSLLGIHMGGKSEDAGLPLVSEIMNAGLPPQKDALDFAQAHSGKSIHVDGVWRLWFEHPPHGAGGQVQNINGTIKMTRPSGAKSWTNPDHLFEASRLSFRLQLRSCRVVQRLQLTTPSAGCGLSGSIASNSSRFPSGSWK